MRQFLLLITFFCANITLAQTSWVSKGAYWKYYTAFQSGGTTIQIEAIDSIIPNTGITVLLKTETFSASSSGGKSTVKSFIYSKKKTDFLEDTYSEGIYFGTDTNNFSISVINASYALTGQGLGNYDSNSELYDYEIDSTFSINLTCGAIKGYRVKRRDYCNADRWVNSAIFYDKIGCLKGNNFFSNSYCTTDRGYVQLMQYYDASGFSYTYDYSTGNTFGCTTGIEEQFIDTKYTISPNPSSFQTTIETSNPAQLQYQVINIDGKTVFSGSFIEKLTFELPQQGLYIVRILDNQKLVYTGKVIKN